MAADGFWDGRDEAAQTMRERTAITECKERWGGLERELADAEVLADLAEEEDDAAAREEAARELSRVEARIRAFTLDSMLSGEDDRSGAIVSINAGAGGTDAQDWAEMLLRMYLRWAERRGYETRLLDLQPGDEAGIKSATFQTSGGYAYGYLKREEGVHRLVRISPFNASGKRQTSFASVSVYPEVEKEIVIDIEEKDLRIDTFRASGSGGQHVNKTSSAIRVLHIPTGIIVQCQQEKSQHRNKDMAMKVLRSRLYQREKDAQKKQMQEVYESKDEIAWGNQIRSYVLQPYQMVKDHRINMEIGNVSAVLDGEIDPVIEGVLLAGM
jgi:peptide chain release factor 2